MNQPPPTSGRRFINSELTALVKAWKANDDGSLGRIGSAAGVNLVAKTLHAIEAGLAPKEQARFEQALIGREALLATIGEALAHPAGLATKLVTMYESTVACLVVVAGARVLVFTGRTGNQTDQLSKIWSGLKPWHSKLERNRERVDAWLTEETKRIHVFAKAAGPFEFARVAASPAEVPAAASETAALLAAVVADPTDEAARVVLADALQGAGDAHGELIALELEAARAAEPERKKLLARAKRLYTTHGDRIAGEIAECTTHHELARGFVTSVTMTASSFAANGERIFSAHPIERLALRPLSSATFAKLCNTPALSRVRELELGHGARSGALPIVDLAPLAASPHLANLRLLRCAGYFGSHWTDTFARMTAPRFAELIIIGHTNFEPESLAALAKNQHTALASISVSWHDDKSSRATLKSIFTALGAKASLRHIKIFGVAVDAELVGCLVAGAGGQALERLDLDLDDAGLAAIAASKACSLRELDLGWGAASTDAIVAFMASPAGRSVEKLHVVADETLPGKLAAKLPAKHPLREIKLGMERALPFRVSERAGSRGTRRTSSS